MTPLMFIVSLLVSVRMGVMDSYRRLVPELERPAREICEKRRSRTESGQVASLRNREHPAALLRLVDEALQRAHGARVGIHEFATEPHTA